MRNLRRSAPFFEIIISPKTIGCQPHGTISSLADEFGVSRKTLYQTRDATTQALQSLSSDTDEADVITTVWVDANQLRRTIVALACTAPNSIRAIETEVEQIITGLTNQKPRFNMKM